jgi:hypothetical protein
MGAERKSRRAHLCISKTKLLVGCSRKLHQDAAGLMPGGRPFLTPRWQARIRTNFVRRAGRPSVTTRRFRIKRAQAIIRAVLIQFTLQRGHGTFGTSLAGNR